MRTFRFTHHVVGTVAVVLATVLIPQTSHAQAFCPSTEKVTTRDVSGVYENRYMHFLVDNCGNARLIWENPYGNHVAYYKAETRAVKGGGVLFYGVYPSDTAKGYMDGTYILVMRPAEPMWITLETLTPNFADIKYSYRLYKWEEI